MHCITMSLLLEFQIGNTYVLWLKPQKHIKVWLLLNVLKLYIQPIQACWFPLVFVNG